MDNVCKIHLQILNCQLEKYEWYFFFSAPAPAPAKIIFRHQHRHRHRYRHRHRHRHLLELNHCIQKLNNIILHHELLTLNIPHYIRLTNYDIHLPELIKNYVSLVIQMKFRYKINQKIEIEMRFLHV